MNTGVCVCQCGVVRQRPVARKHRAQAAVGGQRGRQLVGHLTHALRGDRPLEQRREVVLVTARCDAKTRRARVDAAGVQMAQVALHLRRQCAVEREHVLLGRVGRRAQPRGSVGQRGGAVVGGAQALVGRRGQERQRLVRIAVGSAGAVGPVCGERRRAHEPQGDGDEGPGPRGQGGGACLHRRTLAATGRPGFDRAQTASQGAAQTGGHERPLPTHPGADRRQSDRRARRG